MSKEQTPTVTAAEPDVESVKYEPKEIINWEDLDAKMDLLRGIYANGFETPSPIQKKAISPMFDKKDVIAQAQSGTGKTGCFAIASLQLIDTTKSAPQVMILSPTRELAMQTQSVINNIGNQIKGMKTQLLIGGTSTEEDIRKLSEDSPQIIIGCPGRVHDMMRRKRLNTRELKLIVLDEADEMLSSGFKEQVYNIFQYMPNEIQVALFSATMPSELSSLTEKFMRNPIKILVKTEQLTLEGIEQFYIALDSDDQKFDALRDLYGAISMSQCIIYCNSVKRVSDLYDAMTAENFPVCQIHSNMEKEDRIASYEAFKSGSQRVLISSNVTARGIDIQQVSTVVNFDVPKCVHTYLHRIGRSGRWGRKGIGINFVTRRDARNIKDVENHYHTQIKELPQSFVA
jgi:translation initiation factor 4A|tara:strand:- start:55 stop:1257 length:1203 start_codon:yes stop_codon:yes gene_type:complete